jgi:hypothetical protein
MPDQGRCYAIAKAIDTSNYMAGQSPPSSAKHRYWTRTAEMAMDNYVRAGCV